MKKQVLTVVSKLVKEVVKVDGTKACFGMYYQPKRNKK